MKLGERIAEKRKAQGLTQAELAAVLDVSCDYLLKDDDGLQGEAPLKTWMKSGFWPTWRARKDPQIS